MDLGIQGLCVLVTAGASGIGLAIARAFVTEGAGVHICDIDEQALAAVRRSNPKVTQTLADIAKREDVKRLFADAIGALGGLDVLINNAGIARPTGRVEEIAPEALPSTLPGSSIARALPCRICARAAMHPL